MHIKGGNHHFLGKPDCICMVLQTALIEFLCVIQPRICKLLKINVKFVTHAYNDLYQHPLCFLLGFTTACIADLQAVWKL